jgi:general secretion pathway protein M
MKMLPKSIKRAACLSILGLLCFSLYTYLIDPVASFWKEQTEHAESMALRYSRYKDLLASADTIKNETRTLEEQILTSGIVRKENAPAMVAAEVQSQVRQIVGELGGTVLSTADLPHDENKSLMRVGIHANCEGDLTLIVGILAAIERQKPMLFIENVSIRAPDLTQSQKTLDKLAFGFDAYGYVLGITP